MPVPGPGQLQAIPQIIVEVGFGSNPLTQLSSQVWTDISAYVMSFSTNIGRQHELSRVEAGKATLTLNNADARFDPFNTSSPYNPNVVPAKRLRIRAVWNNATYYVFTGFVESWGEQWPNPNAAFMNVTVVDAFKMLNLKNLLNPYAAEVMKDSPTAYFRLGDSSAAQGMADSSGNGNGGTYVGSPAFGQGTPPMNPSEGVNFWDGNSAGANWGIASGGAAIKGSGAFSVVAWVQLSTTAGATSCQPVGQYGGSNFGSWVLGTTGSGGSPPFGLAFESWDSNTNLTVLQSAGPSLNDGKWHQFAFTRSGTSMVLYLDGAVNITGTGTASPIVYPYLQIGRAGFSQNGPMAEVSIYNGVALSAARIAALYTAGSVWLNDLSGARVNHVLDAAGWPSADRGVEVGLSTFQADVTPGNALANLTDCAKSENGLLFQAPDGTIKFFQRSHPWTTTASLVSQMTLGDAATEEPYVLPGLRPFMDDLDLYNDVQVTRIGGVLQEAQDSTSQTNYGPRTLSETNLKITTDRESLARAQYELNRFKAPLTRVRSVTVKPLSDPLNLYPQVLGRALWDRITFKRRPPGGGTLFQQDSIIEGIAHDYSPGLWKTTFALSPVDALANQYFILDSATQGVLDTNVLAY